MSNLPHDLESSSAPSIISYPAASPVLRDFDFGPPRHMASPSNEGQSPGELMEHWRTLRRHKWSIALFALGGALLGILVGIPQTPVYQARTSLEILSLNEDFLNMKQSNPVASNESSGDSSELQTQSKLLEGEELMQRVLAKLHDGKPIARYAPGPATGWREILHLPQPARLTPRENLLLKAAKSVKIRPTPRTRIIEMLVQSPDRQLAWTFANTMANEFATESLENRWKVTQRTSEYLGHEISDTRKNLEKSEDALQSYARQSGLLFTDDSQNTNVSNQKLQQIQQQLSLATAERIAKQSRYELARTSAPDSLPDVLNDPGLREAASKITDLRRQIAELSVTYTPEYSKLQRLQAQLVALEDSFQHDRATIIDRVKDDYQDASRRESLLSAAYIAQTKEVTGQDEKAVQYNILKREVESNRQLYDTMLQQLKQSSLASALGAAKVRIIDPADLPSKPVSPDLPVNAGLGLFSGFFIGILFVFIRERTNRALQNPGDAQFWTNLPELGTIPTAFLGQPRSLTARRAARGVAASSGSSGKSLTLQNPARNKIMPEMMTWQQKPSIVSEAFRGVLTSILFSGNGHRPRVLVFSSAGPGEGKTTVVSNLGIALAEIETRVLVIDADLRCPRLNQVFDLPNDHGLSNLLQKNLREGVSPESLVQKTDIPGLDVLTSGPSTHAAANLLHSPFLAEILTRFRGQYGMILIDTPPMLHITDARVIGRLADAVVLVARSQQTTRDELVAAKNRFAEDHTRILGTVFNDWDPKHSPYGLYSKGKSYYSKGYFANAER
ncbi:MAG: lipopolysaccharide biosynthesis [Bryobacterales bacterium]|nr:lipopolysaccharide biosynthesis [Bryobacterales bacterium]